MVYKTTLKRAIKITVITALLGCLAYQSYMAYMWEKSAEVLAGYTLQVQKYALETTDEYNACLKANSIAKELYERSF